MRILFTGGGTGGHINPALAIANYIRARHPEAELAYVGTPKGMEATLVPKAGYRFIPMEARGFQRKITLKNIHGNFKTLMTLLNAPRRAEQILKEFHPDLVFGTGGYVTGPLLRQAAKMGIRTATHESNAFPGVTTKLLSKYVDVVMLAVEEARSYLSPKCRAVVTGNPIREEMIYLDRNACRKKMGIGNQVCILSFGGSLGAKRINEAIAQLMAWHCKTGSFFHIHATGSFGVDYLPELLEKQGIVPKDFPNLLIREYLYNMPECMAAADLVISRSGAITLGEIEAAGKASILIPSPNVSENHQYHNAMVLGKDQAAVVLEEKDLTGARLIQEVKALTACPETLTEYGRRARKHAVLDATQRMYQEIMALLQ
mgnify:CR=1 FL=1